MWIKVDRILICLIESNTIRERWCFMRKRILLPVLAIISVVLIAGCQSDGPEQTVDGFISSVKSFEVEKAGNYLSSELKEEYNETVDEGSDGISLEDVIETDDYKDLEVNIKKLSGQLKHKVINTNAEDDTAEVEIELTYADASEPLIKSVGEMFGQIMGLAFSGEEPSEEEVAELMLSTISGNLEGYEAETESTKGVIKLAKEDKVWVITEIDESVLNGLTFGVIKGLEDFDMFGGEQGGELDGNIEFDFDGDVEFNEDIEVNIIEPEEDVK